MYPEVKWRILMQPYSLSCLMRPLKMLLLTLWDSAIDFSVSFCYFCCAHSLTFHPCSESLFWIRRIKGKKSRCATMSIFYWYLLWKLTTEHSESQCLVCYLVCIVLYFNLLYYNNKFIIALFIQHSQLLLHRSLLLFFSLDNTSKSTGRQKLK